MGIMLVGAGKFGVGSRVIGTTGLKSLKWADRELGDRFLDDPLVFG